MFVADFQEDIRITIPAIAEHLKDYSSPVRKAAIEGISRIAAQGMCYDHFPVGVPKHVCSQISGEHSDHHSCHFETSGGFSS